ncbi:MAG: Type 1 glutamine amidotransferase-like domain-containing protein [Eubacteriales bacterium]
MSIQKRIIAIGGGEIKTKETLEIDRYIAALAREHAGDARPYGLFIGTASHDSMPYFNSFRKTYTSVFDIKADVALTVYGEMDLEKIRTKFQKADFIYVGGGDTLYMLKRWREFGLYDLILDAYERGVIICGLSAGAICWFEDIYTDSALVDKEGNYSMQKGLGWIDGRISPHYDDRAEDFDALMLSLPEGSKAYGIENLSALEFVNGELTRSVSGGGNAYLIENDGEKLIKTKI